MPLSDDDKRILGAFMRLIPRLSPEIIDRMVLALVNEKKVKASREVFIERLMKSGMSREDAERGAIEFQRLIEDTSIVKDSVVGDEDGKKLVVKKKIIAEDKAATDKPSGGKEAIDPVDDLMNELNIPEN